MEEESKHIPVVQNYCVSPEITDSVNVQVNDSGYNIIVENENKTQQLTDNALVSMEESSPSLILTTENDHWQHTHQSLVCVSELSPYLSITNENETLQLTEPTVVNEDQFSPNLCIKSENGNRLHTDTAFLIENNFSPTLCIKAENQTQQESELTFVSKNEIPRNRSIKSENELIRNDCHQVENFNTAPELSTKCPSCRHDFTDYLQYLDHRLSCVAENDQLDAVEVDIETDDVTEPVYEYIIKTSENIEQNDENVEENCENVEQSWQKVEQNCENVEQKRSFPEVKQEVNETHFEADKNCLVAEQHEVIDKLNVPTQAVPQLLIQNNALDANMLSHKTESQEVSLSCFYCNETFFYKNTLVRFDIYIEHVQKHLNKLNRYDRIDANHEVKSLNYYLSTIFTDDHRVTATICQNESCNFLFVDMSAAEKHNLIAHSGFEYVCTKVDCHKVFSDKGSLRSHEIVDHAKIIDIYSVKIPKMIKTGRVTYRQKASFSEWLKRQDQKANTCRICCAEFSSSVDLKSHLICDHPNMTVKELDFFSKNGLLKSDGSGKEEGVIGNSLNPGRKRPKRCKSDSLRLEDSVKQNNHASDYTELRPYRNRKETALKRKHQFKYDRNDLPKKLAIDIDITGVTAVTNNSSSGVNEKSKDVNGKFNNIIDNTKDINDMSTETSKTDDAGREVKGFAKRKPKILAKKKVKTKNSKSVMVTGSYKGENGKDINAESQESFQCVKSHESGFEDEKHSVEKDNVASIYRCCRFGCNEVFYTEKDRMKHVKKHVNTFPCQSTGCKMVFETTEERRAHVKEKHMYFHPSQVKYMCTNAGCFKGFYRKFDLDEHCRLSCNGESDVKSYLNSSDQGISVTGKTLLADKLRKEETDSNIIQDDDIVEGNIRKLSVYICPMNKCFYGSGVKNNIYEHLITEHNGNNMK